MANPLITEITYQNPANCFSKLEGLTGAIFLDSAQQHKHLGRYSYIGVDPFVFNSGDALTFIAEQMASYQLPTLAELPPFTGGVMGYIGYDYARRLESLPTQAIDDLPLPESSLASYNLVICFDHTVRRAWIVATSFGGADVFVRTKWLQHQLANAAVTMPLMPCEHALKSNFSPEVYRQAVRCAIDHIYAGDIFEVNLSQRFAVEFSQQQLWALYCRLRQVNPAPFAGYLKTDDVVIASASPERFLQVQQGIVETRPIKGTRARGHDQSADMALQQELLASAKDRAENAMIVDLLRNDLSKVCEDFSVTVPSFCELESYANVHHLVSVVQGKLKTNYSVADLWRACFPGGSITGAPKIRAMEIIDALEPTRRGPYCGSMVCCGFNGYVDSSILIRSFVTKGDQLTFQVGGAITVDSDADSEFQETLTKAQGLLQALGLESAYDLAH